jgi:hydroxymethylglutaryl-CoA lyase
MRFDRDRHGRTRRAYDGDVRSEAVDVTAPVAPDAVLLRDVGPRDGLQAIGQDVSLAAKIAMATGLVDAGVPRVEAGSFVSPKAVPRMADSAQVFDALRPTASREALVVNDRGVRTAVDCEVDVVVGVVSASDTFSHRNVRMSTNEAIAELERIVEVARDAGLPVSVDLSASFGCAFEGPIGVDVVADVAERIAATGAFEIVLADTIGAAAPNDVTAVVGAVRARIGPEIELGLHLHDTRGLALANATAGLDAGIRRFDASVGGLGGCPFSPGATGNVCTEDLVHLFHALGLTTGIDLDALISVAAAIEEELGTELPSRMLRAGPRFSRLAG